MRIEHVAFNVSDPRSMAAWYCAHLGFTVKRGQDEPPYAHFLADGGGRVMIEIYCRPADQVPDYASMDPLLLHLGLVSDDPHRDAVRLVAAGAREIDEVRLEDGSFLKMLRDPWGLALQLCKRGQPMV